VDGRTAIDYAKPIAGGPIDARVRLLLRHRCAELAAVLLHRKRSHGRACRRTAARHLLRNNLASKPGPMVPGWKLEEILPSLERRACDVHRGGRREARTVPAVYAADRAAHAAGRHAGVARPKSGLGTYADFVMQTDATVGRVLEALDRSGAASNTLVFFTSDNGCAPYIGVPEMEKRGHFPSGPLRGYKSSVWEGGHRVPFVARWPGVVAAGTVCTQLVHQADLLATLADVLGAKLPENAGEDSFSLLPLLRGGDQPTRSHAISCGANGVPGLRSEGWKYIPGKAPQLYHLAADVAETNNLAAAEAARVNAMRGLLEKLITDGRSTPGPKQRNDVTVKRHES
jgi:arylsulfatase A